MNRLYSVEPTFTVTGAAADHRYRLKASEIANFATSLLGAIQSQSNPLRVLGQGSTNADKALSAIAKDLLAQSWQSGGRNGSTAVGRCSPVSPPDQSGSRACRADRPYLRSTSDQARPQIDAIRELAGEMAAGQVNTLVMLGWNPAFTAPADLQFAANLKKVANSIYLAQDNDETAALSKWSFPPLITWKAGATRYVRMGRRASSSRQSHRFITAELLRNSWRS